MTFSANKLGLEKFNCEELTKEEASKSISESDNMFWQHTLANFKAIYNLI